MVLHKIDEPLKKRYRNRIQFLQGKIITGVYAYIKIKYWLKGYSPKRVEKIEDC